MFRGRSDSTSSINSSSVKVFSDNSSVSERVVRSSFNNNRKLSLGLLRGIKALIDKMDETFLLCMNLSEKFQFQQLLVCLNETDSSGTKVDSHNNNNNNFTNHTFVLADFFARLATEERKRADLIFKWMYDTGVLEIVSKDETSVEMKKKILASVEAEKLYTANLDEVFHEGNKNTQDEGKDEEDMNFEDPLVSLQHVIQQRGAHVASLLQLRENAELLKDSNFSFLQFLRIHEDKLLWNDQETNREAREVMLCLESLRRNKNGILEQH